MQCLLCEENAKKDAIWIKKHKYWNVHVCWFQHTIGTLGLILNRHTEKFTELTDDEILELGQIIKIYQSALNKQFQPDLYNIQQNGNWHHHLHFLILPRYKDVRNFNNKNYNDKSYGEPIIYTKEEESDDIRLSLSDLLSGLVG